VNRCDVVIVNFNAGEFLTAADRKCASVDIGRSRLCRG